MSLVADEDVDLAVRAVHETLAQNEDIGYTTVLKTMQIMTEKGLLLRDELPPLRSVGINHSVACHFDLNLTSPCCQSDKTAEIKQDQKT